MLEIASVCVESYVALLLTIWFLMDFLGDDTDGRKKEIQD